MKFISSAGASQRITVSHILYKRWLMFNGEYQWLISIHHLNIIKKRKKYTHTHTNNLNKNCERFQNLPEKL